MFIHRHSTFIDKPIDTNQKTAPVVYNIL